MADMCQTNFLVSPPPLHDKLKFITRHNQHVTLPCPSTIHPVNPHSSHQISHFPTMAHSAPHGNSSSPNNPPNQLNLPANVQQKPAPPDALRLRCHPSSPKILPLPQNAGPMVIPSAQKWSNNDQSTHIIQPTQPPSPHSDIDSTTSELLHSHLLNELALTWTLINKLSRLLLKSNAPSRTTFSSTLSPTYPQTTCCPCQQSLSDSLPTY